MDKLYMSPTEAAQRYSLSKTTIYELLGLDDAPVTLKVGHRRLIPIKNMDDFMKTFAEEQRIEEYRRKNNESI